MQYNLEMITCDSSIYPMDHPTLTDTVSLLSNLKKEFIGIERNMLLVLTNTFLSTPKVILQQATKAPTNRGCLHTSSIEVDEGSGKNK